MAAIGYRKPGESTVTEEEMIEEIDKVEYLERCKLICAFGGWLDEQVAAIKDQIWANPAWEKAIWERRYDALPKLMLAPAEGGGEKELQSKVVPLFG